jgi:hypothetical protein
MKKGKKKGPKTQSMDKWNGKTDQLIDGPSLIYDPVAHRKAVKESRESHTVKVTRRCLDSI